LVESVLARTPSAAVHDLDDVLEVDAGARRAAAAWLDKNSAVRVAPAARAGG